MTEAQPAAVTARDRQRGSHLPIPSPSGLTRTDSWDRSHDTVRGDTDKREWDESRHREGATQGLCRRNEVNDELSDREGRSTLSISYSFPIF